MIIDEEIRSRMVRIGHARMRRLLYTRRADRALTDGEIESMLPSGFWRSAGFSRLYDYLKQELQLEEDRCDRILFKAMKDKHENPENYGLTAQQVAIAAKQLRSDDRL